MRRWIPFSSVVLLLGSVSSFGQGRTDYLNFESPQVQPIAIMTCGIKDWLLVCNTPDNSVEVFDPVDNTFVARIPVGMEPVSIETDDAGGAFYTANFIGDSVTCVDISCDGGFGFAYKVRWTRPVGDAPVDLELDPTRSTLWVSKRSMSSVARLDPLTGFASVVCSRDVYLTYAEDPVRAPYDNQGLITTSCGQSVRDFQDLVLDAQELAVKEPHAIRFAPGTDAMFVLGHQGGKANVGAAADFDLDLWVFDHAAPIDAKFIRGELGTHNFNLEFADNGGGDLDLYVVGTDAQFHLPDLPTIVNTLTTGSGFVRSMLYRVNDPLNPSSTIEAFDLNAAISGASESLAHVTDVAIYDPPGGPRRAVLAAFNSDRVALVDVSGPASSWTVTRRYNIAPQRYTGAGMAGPRALVIKYNNAQLAGDPGDRIYVANRLDNSFSVIDPASTAAPVTVLLSNDPVPDYVRKGERFLYSAKFSKRGLVACASCHVDARSDQLAWNLGPVVPPVLPLPELELAGVEVGRVNDLITGGAPVVKGPMVTQSLQGLLNYEVNPEAAHYATNAPYHWRGDKPRFEDFNEAFVNLMGRNNELTANQMAHYAMAVNSISYPPNPNQPFERVYSDGVPSSEPNAQEGLRLFHEAPLTDFREGNRSCAQCHQLPDGSSNTITDLPLVQGTGIPGVDLPIETAALRGFRQKEGRLELTHRDGAAQLGPTTGLFGFAHNGETGLSLNDFNRIAFQTQLSQAMREDVTALLRELDWGVAPAVGQSLTFDVQSVFTQAATIAIQSFEAQVAAANAGLVAFVRDGGTRSGYWYRLDASGAHIYQEVDGGAAQLSTTALRLRIDQPDDLLILTAVPLGSERRMAQIDTTPDGPLTGAPTFFEFVGSTPNTANLAIPGMTANWDPSPWNGQFHTPVTAAPEPITLLAPRIFQRVLANFPALGAVGVSHDAPRRLQLRGTGILEGARVEIHPILSLNNTGGGGQPTATEVEYEPDPLILPIHPRYDATSAELLWETAVELDPMQLYILLLGGRNADGISETLTRQLSEFPVPTGSFDPLTWNAYKVVLVNPDGHSLTRTGVRILY